VVAARSTATWHSRPSRLSKVRSGSPQARQARVENSASSAPTQTLRCRVLAAASCAGLLRAGRMMARIASGCTAALAFATAYAGTMAMDGFGFGLILAEGLL